MSAPGPPGTLLCFYDYDTQWGADRSRSPGGPKRWGSLDFEHTERILRLHTEFTLPACFAIVGAAAMNGSRPYHDPEQIRRIRAAGHEIASHSFHHDWLPGLGPAALRETLRRSKAALEDCIGAAVVSFVPPFNQPFDYPAGLSFSRSERREAGGMRSGLRDVCEALRETGYGFCRVAYRPLPVRFMERALRRRLDRPARPKMISGIVCIRLNTPVGFDEMAVHMLSRCARSGGTAVVYAHPHSLGTGGPQGVVCLRRFLEQANEFRRQGRLAVRLPADLVKSAGGESASDPLPSRRGCRL